MYPDCKDAIQTYHAKEVFPMSASQAQPVFGRMIPAMITPFKEDRSIDYDRAQELAVRLMEGGSDSLIIMGTTGECPTASYAEKTNLFKAVVEAHKEYRQMKSGMEIADIQQYFESHKGITPPSLFPGWIVFLAMTKGNGIFEYLRKRI